MQLSHAQTAIMGSLLKELPFPGEMTSRRWQRIHRKQWIWTVKSLYVRQAARSLEEPPYSS